MVMSYKTRTHAGQILAQELESMNFGQRPVVLAIPNGGIPVGSEIANALNAEFDIIIVRKLQIPDNPEAGFGALTSFGSLLLNQRLVTSIGMNQEQIEKVIELTMTQIEARKEAYHNLVRDVYLSEKDVILVDDGMASGYTMLAAIELVKSLSPNRVIIATPTASEHAANLVKKEVDAFICPRVETGWVFAVANAYDSWYDVPDSEVIKILRKYR